MKHYKRGFLNKGSGMAAFEADIEGSQYETDGEKYISSYFSITDCNRKISLDFSGSLEENRENNLHKLNTLIDELAEFRTKMLELYAWLDDKESE
jgi:hypothetical protein